jgi:hypothetical protein
LIYKRFCFYKYDILSLAGYLGIYTATESLNVGNLRRTYKLAEDDPTTTREAKDLTSRQHQDDNSKPQQWEEFGHKFQPGELELLKQSIVQMALSRIDGQDELFVGG